ncbi:VOC family protein [Ktedonospora formicarum]|uniref:Glyoxalase n=1 Tax=Ktedonospora formicarum TaxID=2778364 RepID=A0A8J3HZY2_9CHLR|nr:VOC family protein [Ktedonospora formicarum]GHO46266.1 glyoxalase [Ktedonospora formicarum]
MALNLYMVGLISQDMSRSLDFYRRLGVAIPDDSEDKTHVEVKMGNGLTFFLDSMPARWDPGYVKPHGTEYTEMSNNYSSVLEFYLEDRTVLDAKYAELTSLGYQGHRKPYVTSFGMYFALIKDPDGNMILLSAD